MSISYNGYTFGEYSNVTIDADMQYDDADRTVTYHRYKLRVETTIVAEANDPSVGHHFRRVRQLLSKAGASLIIDHAGFGPTLLVNMSAAGVKDVAFGPKPRMIRWDPVGAENAVEVTWECEFCIPTCEGLGGVRFAGLAAFNYSMSFHIDDMGYTTRTTTGYLLIAMTRVGQQIPDTADAYRDVVIVPKPPNFTRSTNWQLSLDKRRADFTIVDAEIQSPNAYPPGVVRIRANHRVAWQRKDMAALSNVISANIMLAPGQPRGRAWEIFRSIVGSRIGAAISERTVFIQSLDIDEDLYSHSISFAMTYRVLLSEVGPNGPGSSIFTATGLFDTPPGDWAANAAARSSFETHRGLAGLRHNATEDQIIDLCVNTILPSVPSPYTPQTNPRVLMPRLCNDKPEPSKSYIRFEAALSTIEDNPAVEQITIGPDDLSRREFDPSNPAGTVGQTDTSTQIERYIESAPAGMTFEWIGYAERVGYDIPRPDKLKFGNVTLIRKGKGVFRKRFLGTFFCQPVYAAAWKLRYTVASRPELVEANEADPVNVAN